MKFLKRVRRFFQRRIPLLRRKKKAHCSEINEAPEDRIKNEVSTDCEELVPEISVEVNGPLEKPNEDFENKMEVTSTSKEFEERNKEISKENAPFSFNKTASSVGALPAKSKDKQKIKDNRMIQNKNDFIDVKKNVSRKIGYADWKENEMSNGCEEFVPEMIVELKGPLKNANEDLKSEKEIAPTRVFEVNDKEMYNEDAPFSSNHVVRSVGPLSVKTKDKHKIKDDRMIPNKDDFIAVEKQISRKGSPCPLEKSMLWDGPLLQELDESIHDEKLGIAEKLTSSYVEKEKVEDNCELPAKSGEVLEESWNPETDSEFQVNFEAAFGKNVQEYHGVDPWYQIASIKTETFGQRVNEESYCPLDFESDKKIDEHFDASHFELHAKEHEEINSSIETSEIFQKDAEKNEYSNGPVNSHYDFEDNYDTFSDEEKPIEEAEQKKLMDVIREPLLKNSAYGKLFQYSDTDNRMYITEIKDPLKRSNAVRSDLSGYPHVPFWDSNRMKKHISDLDLTEIRPGFFMAFNKRKD